jgi:hypothetical protein
VTALLGRIVQLPVSVETIEPDRALSQVLSVARQYQLTEYDAAYVELALRRGLPFATPDDKLRHAARMAGITAFATSSGQMPGATPCAPAERRSIMKCNSVRSAALLTISARGGSVVSGTSADHS